MLKVLVLGSTGMAGHVVTLHLMENSAFEVTNLSHRKELNDRTVIMDLENIKAFEDFLDTQHLDVVVNCVGILNRHAENRKDRAALLNGYLPHFLEYKYRESTTRVIHLSTDCVFSGKTGSYAEEAFRDGDSIYDRTKAVGEVVNDKDLTLRMSIIGPDMSDTGIGLFNWFMKGRGEINGYVNALWNGITTIELAKAIEAAINAGLKGLYHLAPGAGITKYHLLLLLKEKFLREDITVNPFENEPVNKILVNTRRDFDYGMPSYDEMIEEMKAWIAGHKELYPHYPF